MKSKNLYLSPEAEELELRMTAPLAASPDFAGDFDNGTDDVTWTHDTETEWGSL